MSGKYLRWLGRGAVIAGAMLATFLVLPSPIDAVEWHAPHKPNLDGPLMPNDILEGTQLLASGAMLAPEDPAVDAQGRIYTSTSDGRIVRLKPGEVPEPFARTGARASCMRFDSRGNLIIAAGALGLMRVDPAGNAYTLSIEADGVPFANVMGVAVAEDDSIFFTDASRFGPDDYMLDALEGRPNGRVLHFDPRTGRTTVVLRDLYFASGIALAADDSFLLVAESMRYNIQRLWLKGERRNIVEPFMRNLPGFPAGISRSPRGTFWVALPVVRKTVMDVLHAYPLLEQTLANLPRVLWPQPAPYGFVFEADANGRPLRSLQDPTGATVHSVANAEEIDNVLYLGSAQDPRIARFPL
jgi:sugar lactone lactonase YvrE